MQQPYFSMVIPALNEEAYLPKLLDSLNRQNFKDFEAFVVDGGSNDKTVTIANNFPVNFPFTVKFCSEKNVGGQRNVGASFASGIYLIFCDADVTFTADFFSRLCKILQDRQYGFLSVRIKNDSPALIDKIIEYVINLGMYISAKCGYPLMSGECFIITREYFSKLGGFDKSIIHGEDFDLAQRAAKAGYKYALLMPLSVVASSRRIRREGRWKLIVKRIYGMWTMILHGPIRKPIFKYKMGGK